MVPKPKHNRSPLFQGIQGVFPANPYRSAQLDFWGPIGMVGVIGIMAKVVQELLIG